MANSAPHSNSGQDGFSQTSEFDLKRLTAELVGLRAWEGLVYKRVKDCPELLTVARLWKATQDSAATGHDDVLTAIEMVKRTLEAERPIEYRDSLKVAYGLIVDGLSKDVRIRRYLELPENEKSAHSSASSIERHSQEMAAQLAATLTSFALARNFTKMSANLTSSEEPFIATAVLIRYRMKPGHLLRDISYQRTIASINGGNHTFTGNNAHYSEPAPGTHRTEAEFGCEVARSYYENGVDYYQLRITKTLIPGETFEFAYRVHVNAEKPFGRFTITAPRADIGKLTVWYEFTPGEIPENYWRFSDLHYLSALSRENRRQVPRRHDGSRFIVENWRPARSGLCYGIDWDW